MRKLKTNTTDGAKLLTYQQAAARYQVGLSKMMQLAKQNGALVKFGKTARVDVQVMDDAISLYRA